MAGERPAIFEAESESVHVLVHVYVNLDVRGLGLEAVRFGGSRQRGVARDTSVARPGPR